MAVEEAVEIDFVGKYYFIGASDGDGKVSVIVANKEANCLIEITKDNVEEWYELMSIIRATIQRKSSMRAYLTNLEESDIL